MAVDTENKRRSAIFPTLPWMFIPPAPDGAVNTEDRSASGLLYSGLDYSLTPAVIVKEIVLPENDFRIVAIDNNDIITMRSRSDGVLRNIGINFVMLSTESAGADDISGILTDPNEAKNHKITLDANEEVKVRNFRKLFAKAFGGDSILQWIPIRDSLPER